LLLPGAAREALAVLQAQAGNAPILQVTVRAEQASLTYLNTKTEEATTLVWEDGKWWEKDSGVLYVEQATFHLSDFNLEDVGAMFAAAATISGSSADQQLQINEYNEGRVLMTVTTSPESVTVFFRPDATLIRGLDFIVKADVAEALRDTCNDVAVIAVGLGQQGFWADVRRDTDTIERFIRPAGLPTYSSLRNQSSNLTAFDPAVIDPAVVASLLNRLPALVADNPQATIEFTADTRDGVPVPKLYFTLGFTTLVYDLAGNPV
jgi:hypothetical protein